MSKTKIAVLVSGGGTNLQALIDAQNSGKIHSGEIALVVSNKEGAYALTRAEKARIFKRRFSLIRQGILPLFFTFFCAFF